MDKNQLANIFVSVIQSLLGLQNIMTFHLFKENKR